MATTPFIGVGSRMTLGGGMSDATEPDLVLLAERLRLIRQKTRRFGAVEMCHARIVFRRPLPFRASIDVHFRFWFV